MNSNKVFRRRTFQGAPEFSKGVTSRSRRTWEGTPTNNSGSALLIAILLVAVLGIGTAAVFKHLNRSFDDYARFERELKLVHYADAGIDAAIAALRTGDAPETLELALGEGRIQVKVEREAETLGYGQRLMQRLVLKNLGSWRITAQAALEHEGIVRAEETYSARVRITPAGDVQRLSWQREKKQ
jgi:GNAT superfamily N-acetyltransferase